MDILAHWLWAYAIFNRKKYALMAAFFSVLPDILSFGILVIMNVFTGNFIRGPPALETLPGWVFSAYNMTHSLVIFLLVFFGIFFFTKKYYWPLAGWGIHILVDIPTHSLKYFATPFLWPLSGYKFNGIGWATKWFMILNYSSLALVFLYIAYRRSKSNRSK